ncbi:uncharacterized protein LOC118207962 [Anguilla anguilla]|uniref:uncharacterized protein LOC118207962 n=1 Tax=Anguilla anguilla TaxID=7936 RepID=UPI0015AA6348|nr:uncharacterized protein LOC118207962 [Anguilla anguilla]
MPRFGFQKSSGRTLDSHYPVWMSGISLTSPIRCGGQERGETRHESGAVSPANSKATESWEPGNDSLWVNLNGPLPSESDTRALRKTNWRVSKSGTNQLRKQDIQVGSDELLITCYQRYAFSNMPAIKKERLDGDDMALAAFNQPEYLAPLNATTIPVVTPHPPAYDHIFAHHRAYLGLHDGALHHQHLHQHAEDLMLERFSSVPDFQPLFDKGEPCIEVECGENKAFLYINKLCQGSKGPSIKHRGEWLTPNEFQFVSGRETAKDWKRSIRHKGKSLKTLMSKGILQNRGRLAEKRSVPLPPTRVPKKEPPSCAAFSSEDSEGSERGPWEHAHIKQEDELHYSIMRKSRDGDLSTIISGLRHTKRHGMPEGQPRDQTAGDDHTNAGRARQAACRLKDPRNAADTPLSNGDRGLRTPLFPPSVLCSRVHCPVFGRLHLNPPHPPYQNPTAGPNNTSSPSRPGLAHQHRRAPGPLAQALPVSAKQAALPRPHVPEPMGPAGVGGGRREPRGGENHARRNRTTFRRPATSTGGSQGQAQTPLGTGWNGGVYMWTGGRCQGFWAP